MSARLEIPEAALDALIQWLNHLRSMGAEQALASGAQKESAEQTALSSEATQETEPIGPLYTKTATAVINKEQGSRKP